MPEGILSLGLKATDHGLEGILIMVKERRMNRLYVALWTVVCCLFLFSCCNRGERQSVTSSGIDMQAFEEQAHQIRTDLLTTHPYDESNLTAADSLYRVSEQVGSDYGKLMALQLRYYVYVADEDRGEDFLKSIDEFIKISLKGDKYRSEYYDALNAKIYYLMGQDEFGEARDAAEDALQEAQKSTDKEGLFYANYYLGNIYQNRGEYTKAEPYLLKADEYIQGDSIKTSLVARELSIVCANESKFDDAYRWALRCRSYANSEVYKVWGEYTYLTSLYDSGREKEFIKAYRQSFLPKTDTDGVLPDYMQQDLQARFALANEDWDKAEQLARQIPYDRVRENTLFDVYLRKGDYKKAYETKIQLDALEDSARVAMQQEDLNEMETKLGNSQLRLETEHLKSERQRIIFIFLLVVLALLLIITAVIVSQILHRRMQAVRQKNAQERELFYRNVTHQLRTPMTVVLGMVDQLKAHIPADDAVGQESLKAAQRQSNHLLELIRQLVSASKDNKFTQQMLSPEGELVQPAVSDIQLPPVSGESSTIWVVEDNDDVALLICNMLHDRGYKAQRASDGQQAWEMLQQDMPDLLITDIAMPRMDGLQLMEHIRADENMSYLPIIVVSARVEDSQRLEGIRAGAEVYLAKPFINEELLLRVSKMLEQRERLRRHYSQSLNPDPVGLRDEEQEFLKQLNSCIDRYMESGTLSGETIADELCMSVSTCNRKIKNLTGMTSMTYVRTRRILVAKQLLSTTTKPISDIELMCGFNTPGHFSRIFKAETGLSPKDYRQQNSL